MLYIPQNKIYFVDTKPKCNVLASFFGCVIRLKTNVVTPELAEKVESFMMKNYSL